MRGSVRAIATRFAIGFGFAPVLLVGCVSTDPLEHELSRMRRELRGLAGQLAETRTEVRGLRDELTLMKAGGADPAATRPSGVPAAPARAATTGARAAAPAARPDVAPAAPSKPSPVPALPVVRLAEDASPEAAASGEEGALDDGSPPILIRLGPEAPPEKIAVDRAVLAKPDPVLSRAPGEATVEDDGVPPEQAYKRALALLREAGRPAEARAAFRAFLARHADSSLADNAAFWTGHAWFVERRYGAAIDELQQMMLRYPRSPKIPDALLRVAQSWHALGQRVEAEASYRRLLDEHAKSEAAAEARKGLAALSAKDER